MKTHSERQIHFALFSTPTPDSEEYDAFIRTADSGLANNQKLKIRLGNTKKRPLELQKHKI